MREQQRDAILVDPCSYCNYKNWYNPRVSRRLIMGESARGRLLVVSYTDRKDITRLISARPATRKERKAYESEL